MDEKGGEGPFRVFEVTGNSQENHRKINRYLFMNCGVLVLKKKRKVKTTIHTHTCDTISSDVVHQTELYHFSF